MFGRREAGRSLLLSGHGTTHINRNGDTALALAVRKKDSEMVKFLLSMGVTISRNDRQVALQNNLMSLLQETPSVMDRNTTAFPEHTTQLDLEITSP
jgi:ankyrin repeat protein